MMNGKKSLFKPMIPILIKLDNPNNHLNISLHEKAQILKGQLNIWEKRYGM